MVKRIRLFSCLLDFLFPPTCMICGESVSEHGLLCETCLASVNWIDGDKCKKCGYPLVSMDINSESLCPMCVLEKCNLDWIRSACVYDDASKCIVLPFKHCGKIKYAKFMTNFMIWALRDVEMDFDIIMPVPLAWRRLYHRGYNQATLLAKPIAKIFGVKLDVDSVIRKYKSSMGHKNRGQRARNIAGVFKVRYPKHITGKKILLVDDVYTSGATLNELQKVLKKEGAQKICAVTFCRVVKAI